MLFCMPLRCNLSTFLPSLGTDPAVPPGSIQVARSTICRKQRISMCQESWVSTVAILAQGTHSGRCGNAGLFGGGGAFEAERAGRSAVRRGLAAGRPFWRELLAIATCVVRQCLLARWAANPCCNPPLPIAIFLVRFCFPLRWAIAYHPHTVGRQMWRKARSMKTANSKTNTVDCKHGRDSSVGRASD